MLLSFEFRKAFQNNLTYWFNAECFAVGFASFIGVWIRVMIQTYFSAVPPDLSEHPLIQRMNEDPWIIANLVGCFVMGFGMIFTKELSDVSIPLFKFLTTGLCGCITTFSTWENKDIDAVFNKSNFFVIVCELIFNFVIIWSFFTFSFAFAKSFKEFLVASLSHFRPIPEVMEEDFQEENEDEEEANGDEKNHDIEKFQIEGEQSQPRISSLSASSSTFRISESSQTPSLTPRSSSFSASQARSSITRPLQLNHISRSRSRSRAKSFHSTDPRERDSLTSNTLTSPSPSPSPSPIATSTLHALSSVIPIWTDEEALIPVNAFSHHNKSALPAAIRTKSKSSHLPTALSAAASSSLSPPISQQSPHSMNPMISKDSTAGVRVGEGVGEGGIRTEGTVGGGNEEIVTTTSTFEDKSSKDGDDDSLQSPPSPFTSSLSFMENTLHILWRFEFYLWLGLFFLFAIPLWLVCLSGNHNKTVQAVALAPFGCLLRWALSRIPWLKALWPEMHIPTLLANILGVLVYVLLLTQCPNHPYYYAITTGFCGSLTTVSTFFAEIHTLYFQKGPFLAFRYGFVTFFLASIIVQIVRSLS